MHIVVTNCNTTQEMTEEIVRGARAAAGPGTTVLGLTPAWGPESAEGWLDSYLSATAVIDLLRTFHAVARFRRFNEAAEHVHRSASTVTTQIQKLEDQIGQRLFTRSNQGVELTLYGKKLLGETTEFLKSHDRLLIALMPQRMQGKIRLGHDTAATQQHRQHEGRRADECEQ